MRKQKTKSKIQICFSMSCENEKKNGNGIWITFSHAIEKRLALRCTHSLQFFGQDDNEFQRSISYYNKCPYSIYTCISLYCKYNSESLKLAKTQGLVIFISNIFGTYFVYFYLVFTKTVNSNFRAFWWVPVTWNILGYSLFFDRSQDGVSFRDIFRQKKFEG